MQGARPSDDGAPIQYRIEMSKSTRGAASLHLPGKVLELEALRVSAVLWSVAVSDSDARQSGVVELRASNANDAVWRVAKAAARAFAELSGKPLQDRLSDAMRSNLSSSP